MSNTHLTFCILESGFIQGHKIPRPIGCLWRARVLLAYCFPLTQRIRFNCYFSALVYFRVVSYCYLKGTLGGFIAV